jgi:hypothetical protein
MFVFSAIAVESGLIPLAIILSPKIRRQPPVDINRNKSITTPKALIYISFPDVLTKWDQTNVKTTIRAVHVRIRFQFTAGTWRFRSGAYFAARN